jgi:tetratricopeptide (TPR) repeat protein
LRNQGEYEKALSIFQKAFEISDNVGFKGMAVVGIADIYEKKRDYNKALEYVSLRLNKYLNDWAKEPVLERKKYLEYALQGNYEMTIKHAELAMKAEMKVHGTKKPREDYVDRLNDLKASKEYIISLK